MAKIRQTKLTKAARGQECSLQLFPYCEGHSETVVLCHLNSSTKGMGQKSEDWWGVDGCMTCHSIIDGAKQVDDITPEEIEQAKMRALHRTLKNRIDRGLIKI